MKSDDNVVTERDTTLYSCIFNENGSKNVLAIYIEVAHNCK